MTFCPSIRSRVCLLSEPRIRTAAKLPGPPSNEIEGIFSSKFTNVVAPVFLISDLSSLIEVAIAPITGVNILYSLFSEILIGPITAFAACDARIADSEAARINFLVNNIITHP